MELCKQPGAAPATCLAVGTLTLSVYLGTFRSRPPAKEGHTTRSGPERGRAGGRGAPSDGAATVRAAQSSLPVCVARRPPFPPTREVARHGSRLAQTGQTRGPTHAVMPHHGEMRVFRLPEDTITAMADGVHVRLG